MDAMVTTSLFTLWTPDPVGVILRTGYYRFDTAIGVSGLARLAHPDNFRTELDILAVIAEQKGCGQFRRFIEEAKKRFDIVSVWEDWNPVISQSLARYGFIPVSRTEKGETNEGWRWTKA